MRGPQIDVSTRSKLLIFSLFISLLGSLSSFSAGNSTQSHIRRPLIFVPGILGSRLCDKDNKVVWGNLDSLVNLPRLEIKGSGDGEAFKPCGIITNIQVLGPFISIKQYSPLLSALKTMGYVENKNLFIFDYDWRLSNYDNLVRFKDFVALKIGNTGSLDILAHSMGGIIARLYLQAPENRPRVHKVLYMGTPFLGSSATFATLSGGWGAAENWMAGGKNAIKRIVFVLSGFP